MGESGEDYAREIAEDIRHQRKIGVTERLSWTLMTLLIIAALLGYLGHGPLSHRTTATPDTGLQVEYQRFGNPHSSGHGCQLEDGYGIRHSRRDRVLFPAADLPHGRPASMKATSSKRPANGRASNASTRSSTLYWSAVATSP